MTTINAGALTLLDIAKRKDPNGAIANIVEALSQRNAFVETALWKEGNLETGHVFTTRTGLPSIGWRRFNEGITAGKSRTDQITETCGMMAGLSKVDVSLANIGGNPMAVRASEDKGFIQGFNKEMETGFVYHSTASTPEKINGFSPRLDSTSDPYGSQIVLADASPSGSDQTSIWGVVWGEDSVFGIYPRGTTAGLKGKDLGEELVSDGNGGEYLAYRMWWEWYTGLCVKDGRQLVRVANIDTSALAATGDNIIPAMIKAYHKLENPRAGKLVWYCNRTAATYLDLQARENTKNSTLSIEKFDGREVLMFRGAPVMTTDGITNTEAVIS